MKSVKNFAFALLLMLAIAANVLAGEMPMPPGPDPNPRASATTSEDTTQPSLDPISEQPGETVESSDYLLFEALAALLYLY